MKTVFLFISLFLLTSACGHYRYYDLEADKKTFHYDNLKKYQLAIASVIYDGRRFREPGKLNATLPLSKQWQNKREKQRFLQAMFYYSNQLKTLFGYQRQDLTVVSTNELVKKLGQKNYLKMIYAYDRYGDFYKSGFFRLIKSRLTDIRYLIFVKIKTGKLHFGSGLLRYNPKGKSEMRFSSTVNLECWIGVYDLQEKRLVWRVCVVGGITGYAARRVVYHARRNTDNYPGHSGLKDVVFRRIFPAFIKALPE